MKRKKAKEDDNFEQLLREYSVYKCLNN